jgi:hypothetical protein
MLSHYYNGLNRIMGGVYNDSDEERGGEKVNEAKVRLWEPPK